MPMSEADPERGNARRALGADPLSSLAGNGTAAAAGGFAPFEPPRRTRGGAAGWQRWQMGSLDPRHAGPLETLAAVPAEPAPPPIDFAALDAMREGARKEGYAQGYTQGQTQGYGDGHREGYARGLEAARNEAAQLHALAGNFRSALGKVDDAVAHALVSLALDVARQLVRATLAQDPAALLPAVRELLTSEPALSGSPSLLLHPDDVVLVETHLHGELAAAGWTVRADPSVARGGCIASAASGERDATLPTRWTRVVRALGRDDPWEPPHG
ncbi:flagellar assembly protein FliH [Cupriavidus taiwanensis]|uniref:flagellar assembly protein FliH n=1 Tax=Cupriavidus taiwanensis TaxID=164546 RepID=UPI000E160D72|nr:flagellar assembly protein FliH [Cupriavidus taiwanensis]SOZ28551.1 FliH: Flagellar Biosynthesis protein; flagellar assembly protein [Cupriavidus taiwanensis]SPA33339.1 FliH: Flagellar Biosynthesis protein; flagellar assembly protein [Cupriavidus taiwanensis]